MVNAADTVLAQRESDGNPVRVAMVGAGVTARMIALQLATPIPGMRLVAIANLYGQKGDSSFFQCRRARGRGCIGPRQA